MAWIESHQALLNHRKTLRAASLLKVNKYLLIGHLHALWWWGLDSATDDGELGDVTPEEIAAAAGWPTKTALTFVDGLVNAGFLERTQNGLVLHDWYDYAGKLNRRRAEAKRRMFEARSPHVLRTERERSGLPTNQPNQPTNQQNKPTHFSSRNRALQS